MSKDDIKQGVCWAVKKMPHPEKISRVRLFGSHLHGDARLDSDVDLIIDLVDNSNMGLFELVNVERVFREELNRSVDIVTPGSLKEYIRSKVLSEAEILYEQER